MLKFHLILGIIIFSPWTCPSFSMEDSNTLQDTCPTNTPPARQQQHVFINGFLCKNPSNITASDFKSSLLNHKGDTDNFLRSSLTIVTAAEFSGLNTLGLSTGRIDLEVDGLVMPHSHPRASEIVFVRKGVVIAGFIGTNNQLFQRVVREGDVFVFPKGLLHYCLNAGFEEATVLSVFNSQNPGVVSIADAVFGDKESEIVKMALARLVSMTSVADEGVALQHLLL